MDESRNRPRRLPHWGTVLTVCFVGMAWLSFSYGDLVAVLQGQYPSALPYTTDGG